MANQKIDWANDLAELRKVRDEIRLKVHLAGMDAKTAWQELEPKFLELERRVEAEGSAIADATGELLKQLGGAFRRFRDKFVA